jgi:hypothetical protein
MFLIHPQIRTKYLTGLDPAGLMFTGKNCEVRLCRGDAVFTEAIHTNGHPLIGFGTPDENGRNMLSYGEVWRETVINVCVIKERMM